ncbi:response regulator transcription factor [Alginatibacterium sediminis]|nr:response regulator [Alginatibacterium sediminis]
MLRILIVDDELLARSGLKVFIDWNHYGYEIVAEAENGQQALEIALRIEPDIIISDIQMPIMNGIELVEKSQAAGLASKFVMLSAFDDFDLVKGALKAGADDYVLKLQMEAQDLLETLDSLKQQIQKEQDNQTSKAATLVVHEQDRDAIRQVLLRDLFNGKILDAKTISKKLQQYGLTLYSDAVVLLAFRLRDNYDAESTLEYTFSELIKRSLKQLEASQLVTCDNGYFIGVCSFDRFQSEQSIQYDLSKLCHAVSVASINTLNFEPRIGLSSTHNCFTHFRQLYLESMFAVSHCGANSNSQLMHFVDVQSSGTQARVEELEGFVSDVANALANKDWLMLADSLDGLVVSLQRSSNIPVELVLGNRYVLNYLVHDFFVSQQQEDDPLWAEIQESWINDGRINDLKQFISWIRLLRSLLARYFEQGGDSHSVIFRAKHYVNEHIDEPISLLQISQYLGLSSSYFSRLFSEVNEQCFVDYVRAQKMKHARDLIRGSNKKMYEIAQELGYENVHYFSRVFKKTVGVSAMEYRHGKHTELRKPI